MPVRITAYDGAQTIGGNKILLEDGGTSVFLDFGTSFDARYQYFEEFLSPRARAGLLDMIHMGLLPPLRGIYRTDLEDADGRAWERAKRLSFYRDTRVDAVLLSHAHMDHCGYISFLDPGIPVVATAMTAYLCKAIQDCAAHQFEGEMAYAVPKTRGREGTIGAASHRDAPFVRRPYLLVDVVPPDPDGFWNLSPAAPRGRLFPSAQLELSDRIEGMRFRYFPVDHSIYGAAAIGLETSEGWIVYTGDLRRHGRQRGLTAAFLESAARLSPIALICEGTNVDRRPSPTEDQVLDVCLQAVREASGRLVVADFGPRNVERLLSFLEIARRTGRRLAIMDKDAYLLTMMHAVDPSIPTPRTDGTMRVYHRALREPRTWVQNVRAWYPDDVTAAAVHADPGAFILCMSFFDITELIDIDPPSGIWIYSSSEPHNEEQRFELWRLGNWLTRFNITPLGLTDEPSPFHASGHISGPELWDLIRQLAPAPVIPIHTTSPGHFQEALSSDLQVLLPEAGVPISLAS